jgi:hypothetical protein
MVLTKLPEDPLLDLPPWMGQRQATFRFDLFNGVTGEVLGQIHPLRTAQLTHDTTRTIKRQLNLSLGAEDTAAINKVQDRVAPFMLFPDGSEYPLGIYMFSDASRQVYTSGKLGEYTLNDEMFLVDQPLTVGVGKPSSSPQISVTQVVNEALAGLPIHYTTAATSFTTNQSWGIGATRGQVLEALAVSGDWFSPWFDNSGVMRFINSFDPASQVPDFDWDAGSQVMRENITETDDLLTTPNEFVVVSNASSDNTIPVFGVYTIPGSAPFSTQNRGFTIAKVFNQPAATSAQAAAMAQNLGIRQTVFERVQINTAPDPRHDSYNVIWWQGSAWLELGWTMSMIEGGVMSHLLRKSYKEQS